ncbi:hypothetical protein, unlikely [Trypanosoma brucei brucei TREU927]|uniref:Uncharacterized protein n=1 Tax=Trypanosoma brucei brucei (strain 927/4 GUTat10.1) TaxID=185431 RepID=Q38FD0_TRYB2|nr:hypothetical protein, unlikely [Trypanosoma brucei brucei TREU927]EAN76490.1 hypothetical protein, unlikely [Trypanosoma brucei brucei TREU927]
MRAKKRADPSPFPPQQGEGEGNTLQIGKCHRLLHKPAT